MFGGSNACQHCCCSLHIIQNPPAFLLHCLAAHLANNNKQFVLHSRFCKLLRDIGLWQHPHHLQNKTKFTTKEDPWEIFPPHIIPSSNYYTEIHDGTFPLIAASRKFYPNPKGIKYMGYLTFSAQFLLIISHHLDILHTSYFNCML